MKNKIKLFSTCCNAKVILLETDSGKYYYKCYKCKEPCDTYIKQRKIWNINPKIRIVPNKKHQTKLTPKEIKQIRMEEDF